MEPRTPSRMARNCLLERRNLLLQRGDEREDLGPACRSTSPGGEVEGSRTASSSPFLEEAAAAGRVGGPATSGVQAAARRPRACPPASTLLVTAAAAAPADAALSLWTASSTQTSRVSSVPVPAGHRRLSAATHVSGSSGQVPRAPTRARGREVSVSSSSSSRRVQRTTTRASTSCSIAVREKKAQRVARALEERS
jgi:hypothetical protein